jgi:hypothetical protein
MLGGVFGPEPINRPLGFWFQPPPKIPLIWKARYLGWRFRLT